MDGLFYAKAAAFLGAALAVGVGSIGPALGQGFVGSKACENIGKYPGSAKDIRTAMFLSMAIIETALIYCGLVSAALIWIGMTLV
jgi:F-type H+-transporting ATPase subunit c